MYLLYVSHFIIFIVLYTHNFYHKALYDQPHFRKYKIGIVVELKHIEFTVLKMSKQSSCIRV